ncbi:hypothetical protein Tco_1102858 [Tanacetum coccineum]
MVKGQFLEELGRRTPKTWNACLELERNFIKGKKLNTKWQSGDNNEEFRNHNDNGKQHYDNRSRSKFGHLGREKYISNSMNNEHVEARNNLINTLSKTPHDILISKKYDTNAFRDLEKEIKEAISQGKFEHLAHAVKMTCNANYAPNEAACHIYVIEYFQPYNRG